VKYPDKRIIVTDLNDDNIYLMDNVFLSLEVVGGEWIDR